MSSESLNEVGARTGERLFNAYGPDIIELIRRFSNPLRTYAGPRVSAPPGWNTKNYADTCELRVEWAALKSKHAETFGCHLVTVLTLTDNATPTNFIITCSGCSATASHECDFAKLDVATFIWHFERLLHIQEPESIGAAGRGTKRPADEAATRRTRAAKDAPSPVSSPPRVASPPRTVASPPETRVASPPPPETRKPRAAPKAKAAPRSKARSDDETAPEAVTLSAAEFCSVVRMVIDSAADVAHVAHMLFGALNHCKIVGEHADMAVLLMPQLTDNARAQAVLRECSRLPPGMGRIAEIARILA